MLLLLDNAQDGDQVSPMLSGDAGSVAVVTSRDALAGLVANEVQRLDLDLLPLCDSVALIGSLIRTRVDGDPRAVEQLARLCAKLPGAMRIAAELAVARPAVALADLVAELIADRLACRDAGRTERMSGQCSLVVPPTAR
jgi:hypothetical protein